MDDPRKKLTPAEAQAIFDLAMSLAEDVASMAGYMKAHPSSVAIAGFYVMVAGCQAGGAPVRVFFETMMNSTDISTDSTNPRIKGDTE